MCIQLTHACALHVYTQARADLEGIRAGSARKLEEELRAAARVADAEREAALVLTRREAEEAAAAHLASVRQVTCMACSSMHPLHVCTRASG